jgi:hypothetical protein
LRLQTKGTKKKKKKDGLLKEGGKPLKPPYFQSLDLLHSLSILKNKKTMGVISKDLQNFLKL